MNVSFCFLFRYLTEKVVPGNRVTITGIFSIKKTGPTKKKVGGVIHDVEFIIDCVQSLRFPIL